MHAFIALIPGVRLPIVLFASNDQAAAENAAWDQGLQFLPKGSRLLRVTQTVEVCNVERDDTQAIATAGDEAALTKYRQGNIDWSEAPDWATHYVTWNDGAPGANTACYFTNGADTTKIDQMIVARQFLDVAPGQRFNVPRPVVRGVAQETPSNIDTRPGANPVAANVNGYRVLSQAELDAVNTIKQAEREVGGVIRRLVEDLDPDGRWLSIAKTDLEKGFMALIRSIAKPEPGIRP